MKLDHIHTDERGSIYSLNGNPLNLDEVSFLTCRAGKSRGGCIHRKNSEYLIVIEGWINYVWGKDNCKMMKAGDSITIPPNTPHYMIALTDSIIAEWGCTTEEKKEKYEPFRKIVMEINSKNTGN